MNNRLCKKCHSKIPYTIKVDGKVKNLQNRKFCLVCSPFGAHDTRVDKTLSRSGKQYRDYTNEKKQKHILAVQKRGTELKKRLVTHFGGKCKYCNYSKLLNALSFHHLDRTAKCFPLDKNNLRCRSWEAVLLEANKCELVCIRCHAEIEAGLTPTTL